MRYIREHLCYPDLSYIEDVLAVLLQYGIASGIRDGALENLSLVRRMHRMGIMRQFCRGFWEGSRHVDNLGVYIDSEKMKVYV